MDRCSQCSPQLREACKRTYGPCKATLRDYARAQGYPDPAAYANGYREGIAIHHPKDS